MNEYTEQSEYEKHLDSDTSCVCCPVGTVMATSPCGTVSLGCVTPEDYEQIKKAQIESVEGLIKLLHPITGEFMGNVSPADAITMLAAIAADPQLIVSLTHTNVSCKGDSTGSASVIVSGGIAPYTYLWTDSGGTTASTVAGLPAGLYSCIVTDANLKSVVESVLIEEPVVALTVSEFVTGETIYLAKNGAINLVVTGGTAPYSYLWDNGAVTEDISGLTPGNYAITVTDALGCQKTTTGIAVSAATQITVSDVVTHETVASADDGTITLTVAGGTAPYTYSWSHGPTTKDVTGLAPGTYTVTVTDDNGAVVTTPTITINPA